MKGVVLVKGSWYETPGSPRLPFDMNQSFSFPGVFQLGRACTLLGCLCFDMPIFSEIFVGRHRRGRLVSWVENSSLDCIRGLLKITEGEHNHELLLNLQELGANPFPYIVPVNPHWLLEELFKGEHFVLADLLK